jgi:hypothetical protein
MEHMAMSGSILITAEILRLAEGYVQVDPLGPVPIEGLSTLVEVYEVLEAGPVRARLQAAAARGLTRFVGRDAELHTRHQALRQAGAGRGQVVAAVGLTARIDRLPSEEKRLRQTAAVIGTEVPLPLLQAIAALIDDTLNCGLAHLQATEFLYETQLFPDHGYTFKHALTGQIAKALPLLKQAVEQASFSERTSNLRQELAMRPLQAHCHLDLGKLYVRIGHRDEAHAKLSAAVDLYRVMEMTFWLPQVEAALAQAEGW